MKILNTSDKNISTIEDSAEIYMEGINQVQVNTKARLTFPLVLRSFLRQDPDIMMVGEVRDLETADISIKATQTGHLVLLTLYTNSAPETLLRLYNMRVKSFNIASLIILVMAQQLVRRLCLHCRKEAEYSEEVLIKEGFDEKELSSLKIYSPGSCNKCAKGYRGRVGIYEVMPISVDMQQLIMK